VSVEAQLILASLAPVGGQFPVYRLSIIPASNGIVTAAGHGISCGSGASSCVLTSPSPASVSLNAAPASGYKFMGWTGDCSGGEVITILVDTVKACEAMFEPTIAVAPRTLAIFDGAPGHFVSGGGKRVFSPPNSQWSVTAFNGGSTIDISIDAAESGAQVTWFLQLIAPLGKTLRVGSYAAPPRLDFDLPRMFFGGDGRACAATGSFTIHELDIDPYTGAVTRLAADVVHHCDAATNPMMVASIQYQSTTEMVNFRARHDINGDGRLDLFWQHETDGWIAAWQMRGTRVLSASLMTPQRVADSNWRIVGSADFNRDGGPDLFWHNRGTGMMTVWYMNGAKFLGPGLLASHTVSDRHWQIRAFADFNGDSNPDLLWQHAVSGDLSVWLMDGLRLIESRPLTPSRVTDRSWRIAGSADFNADGHADLVWRNHTNGQMVVWYMNGTSYTGGALMSPVVEDPDWQIQAIADINDDGSPDLIWQHCRDGRLSAWLMNGVTIAKSAAFEPGRLDDSAWRIVGPR
jgi:hypothetical protein